MATASAPAPLAADAAVAAPAPAPSASPSPSPLPPWRLVGVTAALLPQIALMEEQSYAPDEMCTPENFRFRLDNAQPFFKAAVAVDETEAGDAASAPRVLGFVVGTLSTSSTLHHESMAAHDPSGRYLCVHSVVVDGGLRRRGLAGAMLRQFVAAVAAEQSGAVDQMALICKAHLIKFYESCRFALVGPSAVVHGKDQWFECRLRLDGRPLEGQGQGQAQAEAPRL